MNIILLSGGSGQRLWPLSNNIRSKQFIKLFRKADGQYESMVQRVCRQIHEVDPETRIVIATGKSQVSELCNQIGEEEHICVEPTRRDTFPAIALAAMYLKDVLGIGLQEPVIICPVDPYVEVDYFWTIKKLEGLIGERKAKLYLMGVEPTYPSEKYGYIIPEAVDEVSMVSEFREKPNEEMARNYISRGALWNCGVFGFELEYIVNRAHELIDFTDYYDLFGKYETLPKISFDYAVAEKEKSIAALRFAGDWKDIGTWNTFAEEMSDAIIGDAELDENCENVNVINELNIPIIGMGLKNMILVASNDGILVTDRHQSSYVKPYVEKLDCTIRYAEKSWGTYTIIDMTDQSLTVKVTLNAGHCMNYHSHCFRKEIWTVVSGKGKVVKDDAVFEVSPGYVIELPIGCRHTVLAEEDLTIIEVQQGEEISVHDKHKYSMPLVQN